MFGGQRDVVGPASAAGAAVAEADAKVCLVVAQARSGEGAGEVPLDIGVHRTCGSAGDVVVDHRFGSPRGVHRGEASTCRGVSERVVVAHLDVQLQRVEVRKVDVATGEVFDVHVDVGRVAIQRGYRLVEVDLNLGGLAVAVVVGARVFGGGGEGLVDAGPVEAGRGGVGRGGRGGQDDGGGPGCTFGEVAPRNGRAGLCGGHGTVLW